MKNNTKAILPMLVSVALLSACGDSSTQGGDSGSVTINVTDAPIDNADAVVVSFSSVTLKSPGNDDLFIEFEPKTIDLLALQGTASQALIENESIPAGKYTQIRLGVNAEFDDVMDSYISIDGTKYELNVPSGSNNGLKLNKPFTVAEGTTDLSVAAEESIYTIDFDLRKSIVDNNNPAGYMLKPVLRMVQNTETGSISGTVDPNLLTGTNCSDNDPLTGNAVYVFAGADVVPDDFDENESEPLTSALVKFDIDSGIYSYEVGFLPTGSYTVAFTCAADSDTEINNDDVIFDFVDNAEVVAKENTDFPIVEL